MRRMIGIVRRAGEERRTVLLIALREQPHDRAGECLDCLHNQRTLRDPLLTSKAPNTPIDVRRNGDLFPNDHTDGVHKNSV
jgi:hypothetical protein